MLFNILNKIVLTVLGGHHLLDFPVRIAGVWRSAPVVSIISCSGSSPTLASSVTTAPGQQCDYRVTRSSVTSRGVTSVTSRGVMLGLVTVLATMAGHHAVPSPELYTGPTSDYVDVDEGALVKVEFSKTLRNDMI